MFSSAIIVFRETLEAALLIGIIAAATRSIARRSVWIFAGMVAGFVGACSVAALTGTIASMFEGMGQELFNATVLAIAVLLLAWHSVWMAAHSRELMTDAKRIGGDVSEGKAALSAIAVIVALAVLREGTESVLFVYGVLSTGEATPLGAITGASIGVLGGAIVGALLYWGMLRIPIRWLFRVTTGLILFLAAGMASRMAEFLVQADVLPPLKAPLWDLSPVLPTKSGVGTLMHALIGYEASPAAMQVVFYLATVGTIVLAMLFVRKGQRLGPR